MPKVHFSISSLLALVVVSAIGFAAIRIASPTWAGWLYSLTLLVMLASILGICFRRGTRRVFWIGFALFGWANLFLANAAWFDLNIGRHLLGVRLFSELYPILHPRPLAPAPTPGIAAPAGGGFQQRRVSGGGFGVGATAGTGLSGIVVGVTHPYVGDFVIIGKSLEALLWGFVGGWTACYLAWGRERARELPAEPKNPASGR